MKLFKFTLFPNKPHFCTRINFLVYQKVQIIKILLNLLYPPCSNNSKNCNFIYLPCIDNIQNVIFLPDYHLFYLSITLGIAQNILKGKYHQQQGISRAIAPTNIVRSRIPTTNICIRIDTHLLPCITTQHWCGPITLITLIGVCQVILSNHQL